MNLSIPEISSCDNKDLYVNVQIAQNQQQKFLPGTIFVEINVSLPKQCIPKKSSFRKQSSYFKESVHIEENVTFF